MFCQLFSLQNKSFLCLQHVENKGFQTVIKHRLKAIQKPIMNELGNREKIQKNAHFVFSLFFYLFCSMCYSSSSNTSSASSLSSTGSSLIGNCRSMIALNEIIVSERESPSGCNLSWMTLSKWWLLRAYSFMNISKPPVV